MIQNFNRIINLYFLDSNGNVLPNKTILCPLHGRKPNIEINGSFTQAAELGAFNIKVKNLYMDLTESAYAGIRVEAGYEGNLISFQGSIFNMYQESPSPEGSIIIQCQIGKIYDKWVGKSLSLHISKGQKLYDVLSNIASVLGLSVSVAPSLQTLTVNQDLYLDGSILGAVQKLKQMFSTQDLVIKARENILHAWSLKDAAGAVPRKIDYLSAPIQATAGGENGAYNVTLSARWEPQLEIGDLLMYPSKSYVKFGVQVNSAAEQGYGRIHVYNIQFQFGTVGSANNMIVRGYKA